jgi:hypothetical protein
MPADEQIHLNQAWRHYVLPTSHGCPPVCVMRLLLHALVPLLDPKTPGFTGGGQLETEYGLEESNMIEGIIEMSTPSPKIRPESDLDLRGIDAKGS